MFELLFGRAGLLKPYSHEEDGEPTAQLGGE